MQRPWKATPEEEEREGPWADYAAFCRWWQGVVEDPMPPDEESIWDGMSQVQQAYVYAALGPAFDATEPAGGLEAPATDETNLIT